MTGRPAGARRRHAVCAPAALVAVAVAGVLLVVPGGPAAAAAAPRYITAAEYFGDANPLDLWSSDLSGAPQSFAQMKRDGFDTVGLVLPWGEFEPGLTPPRFDRRTFDRLDRLIAAAAELKMGVILRLSYEFDVDPSDQLPGPARFNALWGTAGVHTAWLDYIAEIHRNVQRFSNVREAYLSWEDLWEPVFDAQGATTPTAQLELAADLGYRSWLQSQYSLSQVSADYGAQFASWTQVPTPPATQPSFRLMYEYEDWALVHRLFIPASQRYPGLSMETRVDVDPIFTRTQVVGAYSHTAQYQLPGAPVTGMYYSPYMGDPTSTPAETASDAVSGLQTTLSRMRAGAGGRPLFIYEYEIESNSPEVSGDPQVVAAQLPTFVRESEPLLAKYTTGYALWTYRDYYESTVYNPSFALGSTGWHLSKGARAVARTTATSYLALGPGGSARQALLDEGLSGTVQATLTFRASAPTATDVTAGSGGTSATVRVSPGWHTYGTALPVTTHDVLTLRSSGRASVTDVQLHWFTQVGDVYSPSGTPEVGLAALRSVNTELTSGSS